MDITTQLASQFGERGQDANIRAADRCLAKPELLSAIAARLTDNNARLVGDCAEVLTKVAEQRPALVAPHAQTLLALVAHNGGHKNGRVRWESAHALALVARQVPRLIAGELEQLTRIARRDKSVIVRDYILDAIAGYGVTGPQAAAAALPILHECASAWGAKHAARILRGLEDVAEAAPMLVGDIRTLATQFDEHPRPGIRKAAKSVLKRLAA